MIHKAVRLRCLFFSKLFRSDKHDMMEMKSGISLSESKFYFGMFISTFFFFFLKKSVISELVTAFFLRFLVGISFVNSFFLGGNRLCFKC